MAKKCRVTVVYIQACDEATRVVILGTIAHYAHTQTHTQIIINLRYEVKLHSSVVDE